MKKKIVFCFLIFAVIRVGGHEFWIQPDKFIYRRGEVVNLRFLLGENFNGGNWTDDKEKIHSLCLFFGDVADKNLNDNFGSNKGDSLQLAVFDEGTVMVTLNTKNSFLDLDAPSFNDYLREDGLADALDYREKHGDTAKTGREFYQRSVKTIFQVGGKYTNTCKQKTALPLDIVPDDHPYSVARDGNFKVKVFFMGDKLKNAKIRVWHKLDDNISVQEHNTDDDGEIKFFLSPEGEWMISCVKMVRLENDPKADWQSYWASVTWGYY